MSDDEESKEGQLEVTAPRFTHLTDEQIVRLHLYDGFGFSGDVKGDEQIKMLNMAYNWIMTGEGPSEPETKPPKLRTVK